jgi:predicted dehydrogenase/aryl-alcohol dehydrogenase-like predicted oxidoreductase
MLASRETAQLRWGILGTGRIARIFAHALASSRTGRLVAVGSRAAERAEEFARAMGVPRAHADYQALLEDPELDAVYIATPHPSHASLTILAARAHKHVLAEKPLGMNHAEAMAMFDAARRHQVFLMEAFMYRCHPLTARLAELVREGAIGRIRAIQATFSFEAPFDPQSRLFDPELGGGGILDVGCYPVSMARLIAGAAAGTDLAEPTEVVGLGVLGETGVDEWASAIFKFPGDVLATLAAGIRAKQDNVAYIHGSEGSIFVPWPWRPDHDGAELEIRRPGRDPEVVRLPCEQGVYTLEADLFAASIPTGTARYPAMTAADSLGNAQALDRWRRAIGLAYPGETSELPTPTVSGLPLERRQPCPMQYGALPGVGLTVARVVMGSPEEPNMAHAAVMFDDYFEQGGNAFDTAFAYGRGRPEQQLGHWIRSRGVRREVVVITKGGHTPYCTPRHVSLQLKESLERLGLDYVDVYLLHRDNLDVPVGEFVDVLNEHFHAGRIKLFGGSNWSRARLEQADAYAAKHGLEPTRVLSNQLSLARMVRAPWPGCLDCWDSEWRAWLGARQMPVLCWSAQARGFFRQRPRLERLVECWHAEDNFERLRRADELGRERGVAPNSIALAWVLAQPYPTFALIGPKTLDETRSSLEALTVELGPAELKWLNLEA